MLKRFWISLSAVVLLVACGNKGELKTIQTQQAGDYTVTVLSETGSIKKISSRVDVHNNRAARRDTEAEQRQVHAHERLG